MLVLVDCPLSGFHSAFSRFVTLDSPMVRYASLCTLGRPSMKTSVWMDSTRIPKVQTVQCFRSWICLWPDLFYNSSGKGMLSSRNSTNYWDDACTLSRGLETLEKPLRNHNRVLRMRKRLMLSTIQLEALSLPDRPRHLTTWGDHHMLL